jgi:hypothetical protein
MHSPFGQFGPGDAPNRFITDMGGDNRRWNADTIDAPVLTILFADGML